MTGQRTPFSYPPLPPNVDSIRTLALAPGDFFSPLVGTLSSVAFHEKPKYTALSYTWGNPYPEEAKRPQYKLSSNHGKLSPVSSNHARSVSDSSMDHRMLQALPDQRSTESRPQQSRSSSETAVLDSTFITLNGQPFRIGNNLYLALLHLRSLTHEIVLWIDAICINQSDTNERNSQVSLMSFIYTRAMRVLSWLGPKNNPTAVDHRRSMSVDWKAGQTQYLAASLARGGKIRYSSKPSQATLVRIAESEYWKRLWIVQEVCLPRLLILVYGPEIWAYDEFQEWYMPTGNSSNPPQTIDIFDRIRLLLDARGKRHTELMNLENLIERFAHSDCCDIKDRVYGMLGCANDVRPVAGLDVPTDMGRLLAASVCDGKLDESRLWRGIGTLQVDYSSSYYKIWTNVVNLIYYQAKPQEKRVRLWEDYVTSTSASTSSGWLSKKERRITIVRMAAIVQQALGQKVEEELAGSQRRLMPQDHSGASGVQDKILQNTESRNDITWIQATGYIAGKIVHLGPDYTSFVASSRSQYDWKSSWVEHYQKPEDLEALRRIDEEYTAKILMYEQADVDRLKDIPNPSVLAWPAGQDDHPLYPLYLQRLRGSDPWKTTKVAKGAPDDRSKMGSHQPRMCLGTGHVIGLVPPSASPGDIIVRFWNCNASIVMRLEQKSGNDNQAPAYRLIGRADVAEVVGRSGTTGRDLHAETFLLKERDVGDGRILGNTGAVDVNFDLSTLQMVTSSISV